jgi:cellulose synthase/poly-beta-1,6-N-acetylglucosamine synthase-like glycosyltransferase
MNNQTTININRLPISVLEYVVKAVSKLEDKPHYLYINSNIDQQIANSSNNQPALSNMTDEVEVWSKEAMTNDVLGILGQLDNSPQYIYGSPEVVQDRAGGNKHSDLVSKVKDLIATRRHVYTQTTKYDKRRMLALLISAHNEELVLKNTIQSAINAGCAAEHIYVVDDNSSDSTSKVARSIIPEQNVIKVRRSGKGLALTKAAKKFKLSKRYKWIHIADADGAFSPYYFWTMRKKLRPESAAATGYVRSLPGKNVSQYRAFEYTVGMEIHRRIQNMFGVIPVIPGPTSCFRADVFNKLNFANGSLTEDFDVTLQLHRLKLGDIQFIPEAVAYTQDPATMPDFIKQISRWNRGTLQGILKYRIGRKATKLDAYLSYQVILNLMVLFSYLIWLPFIAMNTSVIYALASTFIFDVALTWVINMMVSVRLKRWDLVAAFPHIYAYKWISIGIFLKAFVEVFLLKQFRSSGGGVWENNTARRYAMPTSS